MAKEYQSRKNNPYELPYQTYMQVIWLVRDYNRILTEYHNAIDNSPPPDDGQPKGNGTGNPTEIEGLKRATLWAKIEAIDKAKDALPREYREGVWNNIVYRFPYPRDADRSTYTRYKSRFVYYIAKNLFWV